MAAVALSLFAAAPLLSGPLGFVPAEHPGSASPGDARANAAGVAGPGLAGDIMASLPVRFEKNAGQESDGVRFTARADGYTLFALDGSVGISLAGASGASFTIDFPGARPVTPQGERLLTVVSNYGRDGASFSNVPNFGAVRYAGLYPGIDVVFHAAPGRGLEYDFQVAPGADASLIRMASTGTDGIHLDSGGDLVFAVGSETFRLLAPRASQEAGGSTIGVASAFALDGPGLVRFELAGYDRARALVIDPILKFSTFVGQVGDDPFYNVAFDAQGNILAVGASSTQTWVGPPSPTNPHSGGTNSFDIIVVRIRPGPPATLDYVTYYGGSGPSADEFPGALKSLAINPATGEAFVAGYCSGGCTSGASLVSGAGVGPGGGFDGLVVKFTATGAVAWATRLATPGFEVLRGIAVDATSAYVVGEADGTAGLFPAATPTAPAPLGLTYRGGADDTFLVKLDQTTGKTVQFGTYVGGSGQETSRSVAVDGAGNAYLGGTTTSSNYPLGPGGCVPLASAPALPQCYVGTAGTDRAGVLTKINTVTPQMVYSTYLGGSALGAGASGAFNQVAQNAVIDASGNAYVALSLNTANFPVWPNPGAAMTGYQGGPYDGAVAKVNPAGTAIVYATYVGGAGEEMAIDLSLDGGNRVWIAGQAGYFFPASGPSVPVTGDALKSPCCGGGFAGYRGPTSGANGGDVWIAELDAEGRSFPYATFAGGTGTEYALPGIAFDQAHSSLYVAGATQSTSATFPMLNPIQANHGGATWDGFVLDFAIVPVTVTTNPSVTCANEPGTYTATWTHPSMPAPAASTYAWTFGGGTFVGATTSASANPQVKFAATGAHFATLKITFTDGSTAFWDGYVTVSTTTDGNGKSCSASGTANPSTSAAKVCVGETLGLTGAVTGAFWDSASSWSWSLPPGGSYVTGTSSSQSPTVKFSSAGNGLAIQLTVTYAGGATDVKTVNVDVLNSGLDSAGSACSPSGTSNPTVASRVCANEPLVVNGAATGAYWAALAATPWQWTLPAGGAFVAPSTQNAQNPTITLVAGAGQTIQLKVTYADGATDTASRNINVLANPGDTDLAGKACNPLGTSSPSVPSRTCAGEDTPMTAAVTGAYWAALAPSPWQWTLPAGAAFVAPSTSSSQNPTATFAAGMGETVLLKATYADGATDTVSRAINVLAAAGDTDLNGQKCAPGGTAGFTFPPALCPTGSTATFSASSTYFRAATSYSWNFGDPASGVANTATGASVSHRFDTTNVYTVTLTANYPGGLSDVASHVLPVCGPPNASFALPPTLPDGTYVSSPLTFSDASTPNAITNSPLTAWAWTFGDGTSGSGPNPIHGFPPGTYIVRLTAQAADGGTASFQRSLTIRPFSPPQVAFTVLPDPLTWDSPGRFFATVASSDTPVVAWSWSFGDGGTDGGAGPSHTFLRPGQYTVMVVATDASGLTATYARTVLVGGSAARGTDFGAGAARIPAAIAPAPTAAAASIPALPSSGNAPIPEVPTPPPQRSRAADVPFASTAASGRSVGFQGPPAASYSWDFGDGSPASQAANPTHAYRADGSYTVRLVYVDATGDGHVVSEGVQVTSPIPSANAPQQTSSPPAALHVQSAGLPAAGWAAMAAVAVLGTVAASLLVAVLRRRGP
jgi:PKD repeat protein